MYYWNIVLKYINYQVYKVEVYKVEVYKVQVKKCALIETIVKCEKEKGWGDAN